MRRKPGGNAKAPFDTEAVERYFTAQTGDRLDRSELTPWLHELIGAEFDVLGNGGYRLERGKLRPIEPRPDMRRKYGEFSIRVWSSERQAMKLYRNVELLWFTSSRQTDDRWRRLDEVLSGLG